MGKQISLLFLNNSSPQKRIQAFKSQCHNTKGLLHYAYVLPQKKVMEQTKEKENPLQTTILFPFLHFHVLPIFPCVPLLYNISARVAVIVKMNQEPLLVGVLSSCSVYAINSAEKHLSFHFHPLCVLNIKCLRPK